jgi:predicted house-cleaning noncanonical NTP pyrophosphatase (MazG superfamily)
MEKLIRDKIHTLPNPQYPNMQIRKVVDIMEHISFLLKKIIEETAEFAQATIESQKIQEAGDLLEVYDTLIMLYESSWNSIWRDQIISDRLQFLAHDFVQKHLWEISKQQKNKTELKGWFQQGIIWFQDSR